MTTKDLRKEINRVIQEVPEDFLEDILSYLKQIKKRSKEDIETFTNLKRIFKEDQELLEKLAKSSILIWSLIFMKFLLTGLAEFMELGIKMLLNQLFNGHL